MKALKRSGVDGFQFRVLGLVFRWARRRGHEVRAAAGPSYSLTAAALGRRPLREPGACVRRPRRGPGDSRGRGAARAAGSTASLPAPRGSVSAARPSPSAGGRDPQRESGLAESRLTSCGRFREAKEACDLPVKV